MRTAFLGVLVPIALIGWVAETDSSDWGVDSVHYGMVVEEYIEAESLQHRGT